MSSVINREKTLSELFSKNKGIAEVYADLDFTLRDDFVSLYILHKHDVNSVAMLFELYKLYGSSNVNIYLTTDPLSLTLYNKRIIWKEGRWYI